MAERTRTVDRAIDLLVAICDRGALSLADAARETELSTSTALRLMRTLEINSLVRRDENGLFHPGSRMMQLGALALSHEAIVSLATPHLECLVEATGESAYLSTFGHNDTAVYLSLAEGTHSIRHTSWVGRTLPLRGSATGAALRGETGQAGYAIVSSGVESDVTSIAAPVRSGGGIVAALSIVLPAYRLPADGADSIGLLVASEAAQLSADLGAPENRPPSDKPTSPI
ncbi:MAG: IclR family transcriptional regulator [Microbacteriaceae bacterium]|nr:MAG: IclR family transcriptional regulator [Microbacteriaceae bacterium]